MSVCHSSRSIDIGYFDLTLLIDFVEYANNLTEFLLNAITLDYVLRTSMRNLQLFFNGKKPTTSTCLSLYKINLDSDFLTFTKALRRLCVRSKSSFYEMKTARLQHAKWIVRCSPNFRSILRIYACNLRHLVKKINEIEEHVNQTNIKGELVRYHAISAALITVKYDLLMIYVSLRGENVLMANSSFLSPILSDIQRWLIYSFHEIQQILSAFPGSSTNRREIFRSKTSCRPSFNTIRRSSNFH